MAVSQEYLDFLIEQLAPLGGGFSEGSDDVSVRRMFGGAGLFLNDLMFALIDDDQLYLKVDEKNRPRFVSEGLQPFTYETKKGTRGAMSYFAAPEAALDDTETLLVWAREGYEAALRAAKAKKK